MVLLALVLGAGLGSLPLILERGSPAGEQTTSPIGTTIPVTNTAPQTSTEAPAASYEQVITKIMESLNFFSKVPERWGLYIQPAVLMTKESPSYSSTNVQVVGIDEHDPVKNDGRYIYVLRGNEVAVVDGKELSVVSRIKLERSDATYIGEGLYLINNTLVILASTRAPDVYIAIYPPPAPVYMEMKTLIVIVNVSDPRNPVVVNEVVVDGQLRGSRLFRERLHIVTQLPCFRIYDNGSYVPVIPQVNGEKVPPNRIIIPEEPARYYVLLVSVDIKTGAWTSLALMQNDVKWIYMSRNRLYVAGSLTNYIIDKFYADFEELFVKTALRFWTTPELQLEIQHLVDEGKYDIAFEKLRAYVSKLSPKEYEEFAKIISSIYWTEPTATQFSVVEVHEDGYEFRGSFRVEGEVLDQFAIEEFERYGKPYAVIATTVDLIRLSIVISRPYLSIGMPSSEQISVTISPSVYVSRGEPDNRVYIVDVNALSIVSSLKDIAKGERIYSARIRGDIFYLVTYRLVDPLFAIDISEPLSPRILGYLKVPGFSEYLHPVTERLLLGIGYGETRNMKISLFDVSDPSNPREVAFINVNGWSPVLANDYHAFTYDERHMTCYIPAVLYTSYYGGSGLGALVIGVDPRGSLVFRGFLQHEDEEYQIIFSRFIRVVYIDDVVFTISSNRVRAWDINTLKPIADIPLG